MELIDEYLMLGESGISKLKSIDPSAKKCDVKTNLFLRELVGWLTCICVVIVLEEKISKLFLLSRRHHARIF